MIPKRIAAATHRLGAPDGWRKEIASCARLWVRKVEEDGFAVYESAWEPTPDELAALLAGGSVVLRVAGGQPPVMLYVEPAPTEEPE